MRLDGVEIKEIEYEEETEGGEEMNSVSNSDSLSTNLGFSRQVVVGYALTTKKRQSFLQPKFEVIARYMITHSFCLFFLFLFLIFSSYRNVILSVCLTAIVVCLQLSE